MESEMIDRANDNPKLVRVQDDADPIDPEGLHELQQIIKRYEPIDAEDLIQVTRRLDQIEKDIAEFKELAGKIWGFIEKMKDNPMLAAMLGGIPRS